MVVSFPAIERVVAGVAEEVVVAPAAFQGVVAIAAIEQIVTLAAPEVVGAVAAVDRVVAGPRFEHVVARAAPERILARAAEQHVGPGAARENVIPGAAVEPVAAVVGLELVVSRGAAAVQGGKHEVRRVQDRNIGSCQPDRAAAVPSQINRHAPVVGSNAQVLEARYPREPCQINAVFPDGEAGDGVVVRVAGTEHEGIGAGSALVRGVAWDVGDAVIFSHALSPVRQWTDRPRRPSHQIVVAECGLRAPQGAFSSKRLPPHPRGEGAKPPL